MAVSWKNKENFNRDPDHSSVDVLVDLYIFADAIYCNGLRNCVMDRLQDVLYLDSSQVLDEPNQALIQKIFDNTTSTSSAPIRFFCAAPFTL